MCQVHFADIIIVKFPFELLLGSTCKYTYVHYKLTELCNHSVFYYYFTEFLR